MAQLQQRYGWVLGLACLPILAGAQAADAPPIPGLAAYEMPRFPIELRGVKSGDGVAVIVVTVDDSGAVLDSFPLAASHEAFVRSATEALASWRFKPADSPTLPRREVLEFEFRREGVVTTLSHAESASEAFVANAAIKRKTVQWRDLDSEPKRLQGHTPAISKAMLESLGGKPLIVQFIVDEQGRVRVPVVYGAAPPSLTKEVLEAVRHWVFTPPMYQGQPVATEATRSMVTP